MGLTKRLMDKIKAMHSDGHTYHEIAKALNIPEKVIKQVCLR